MMLTLAGGRMMSLLIAAAQMFTWPETASGGEALGAEALRMRP